MTPQLPSMVREKTCWPTQRSGIFFNKLLLDLGLLSHFGMRNGVGHVLGALPLRQFVVKVETLFTISSDTRALVRASSL